MPVLKALIGRNIAVAYPGFGLALDPISESKYEDMLLQYRTSYPEKYHQRSILVENGAVEKASLTCYFTEEWTLFGHAVQSAAGATDAGPEYVRCLPKQRFRASFEAEL